jgi:thymidine phosphorylase
LLEITRMLSAELLLIGGLASDTAQALQRVDVALDSGAALERFSRMVAALGGPSDFAERAAHHLPSAPVQAAVLAPRAGWVSAMATRDIGLLVIELGGGRRQASDRVDPRVGLSQLTPIGQRVEAGQVLARVHAADAATAQHASLRLLSLIELADTAPAATPVLLHRLEA